MKTILLYPFKLALSILILTACLIWAIITPDKFLKFWSAVHGIIDAVQKIKGDSDFDDYLGVIEKERMN